MEDLNNIKKALLNTLFPKFCLGCQKEGTYLCQDCQACLDISESYFCLCPQPKRLTKVGKCEICKDKSLDGIYSAVSYQNQLVKKLIKYFKEEPYLKELADPLSDLIIFTKSPPLFFLELYQCLYLISCGASPFARDSHLWGDILLLFSLIVQ